MRKLFAILVIPTIMIPTLMVFCYAADKGISWTEDELAFMDAHPVIRLGVDPGFVPFEFIDVDGEYKGIAADYLSLIRKRTGLEFEIVKGLTWPEAYEMAVAGNIDAMPAIGVTEERSKHFLFSKPYYYFKRAIVTRNTETSISGINDLNGITVAVQRNSSHHSYLLSYPQINLSLYDSVEAALTAVATGMEKAFVGNLATTDYLIRSNALTNLRFVSFEAEKEQALCFAVRKDWPELVSIFNKAMATVTENEKIIINKKWIELEQKIDYSPIIRIVLILGALAAVILSVSFYWIAQLRKEVEKRKLIQADLEKAIQMADEANEYKSDFMARMSHEIRTPLNAITGMTYLLKKTSLTPTQNMYAGRITQASSTMLNIINDILDLSKIEAGKADLETASFSINQAIQNVVDIVSYNIEEKQIRFKLSKDPLIPDWLIGDSKRIEQVLLNILNNAVKFTDEGEVSLDVRLKAKENDIHHISFTIKDTGIGMTEEQVDRLFVPFVQGDSSINRRFGGSGLGMAIVKNLIDLMGGEIQVFSTVGKGSTFIVHLSLSADKEKKDMGAGDAYANNINKEADPVTIKKSHSVLVVEDNNANLLIAKSLLQQIGIEPIAASDGKEAVELYCRYKDRIALILMDLHMPVMNGYEAAKEIRKISADVPIIAMTADVVSGVKEKCEQSGIYHCISKPFDPDQFIYTVVGIISESEDKDTGEAEILDKTTGLKNMGGNIEVYHQVINEYYKENKETLSNLSQAITEKRYADAAQMIHKIKSSSGSIGAKSLYELSIKLQRALCDKKEDEIPQLLREYSRKLSKLLEEIKNIT